MSKDPIPYSQAAKLDPRITIPRPIIDPSLAPIVDFAMLPDELDLELMRSYTSSREDNPYLCNASTILKEKPHLKHTEHSIPGPDNNSVTLSVFSPKESSKVALPVLYHIHGGGMLWGDRFSGVTSMVHLLGDMECIIVSVEYRLAPETRAPGAAEDCFSGLLWISENAASLGIDPNQIIVYGISGGGALAAVICLMARDRKLPAISIKGQMLHTPMLDNRCHSVSDQQFLHGSPASGLWLRTAWKLVLGDDQGSDNVTPYQVPSRETDLSNLPPTYIDAAECEVIRDPAVLYAMNMWRCGSTCELHIWPGVWHGFDMMENPDQPLIQAAIAAKHNWLKRIFKSESKIPAED